MTYDSFLESKGWRQATKGIEAYHPNPSMFEFQSDITRWALRRGRSAIFADCGLGKTLMQLEWARHIPGRVLILAPLAVADQTVREGAKFGIDLAYAKSQEEVDRHITVTNYDRLERFDASSFDGIVLDESSILKSYDGKTRAMIIEMFSRTPYRLACTATPAPNDFMELGNHAQFLGAMTRGEMLSMFFVHDGGETQKWRLKKHAVSKFWEWVCSWAVMVTKPSDLGYEDDGFILPELVFHETIVKVENQEFELFPTEAQTLQERIKARRDTTADRCEHAAHIINDTDEPCIAWCNLNVESETLAKLIPDAVEVRGSDSREKKEAAILGFSEGSIRVLVTKPKICGFGMNWQHCRNVVFVGLSDSYEQFYQAVRRCWRFGQTRSVNTYIITAETEGAVAANIKRKEMEAKQMAEEMISKMQDINSEDIHALARSKSKYRTSYAAGQSWDLHLGDCIPVVSVMEDESIDYTIYSPPFASLYTYSNSDRDMGNSADMEEFAKHYAFLVNEMYRVTKPGRLISFHCMNIPSSKTHDGYIGLKDFRGDLIRAHQAAGWIYHSEVCIWKDPVTAMQRTKALGLLHKQIKKDSCMSRQGIADYLVTMRKPGENPERVSHTDQDFPVSEWQKIASPIWMDINPSDTLQFRSARADEDERHICPLQLEVIRRALRLWSNSGDLILSPFAGIGSEGFVAIEMGRRFVGVELKESYYDQAKLNLASAHLRIEGGLFADLI